MDFEKDKTYAMTVIFTDAKGHYVNVLAPDKKSYRVDIEAPVANGVKSLKDRKIDFICTGEAVDVQPNFVLAPKYYAKTVVEPIPGGDLGLREGLKVEFKKSIIFSSETHQPGSDKLFEIAREIAAFMNTDGGELYCGVSDDGRVVGIENDLKALGKAAIKGCNGKSDSGWNYAATADGFSQKLRNLVRFHLGDFASTFVGDPEFIKDAASGHVYVRIVVRPSADEFVYLGAHENVYYRTGTSSVLLEGRSREQYAKARFGFKTPEASERKEHRCALTPERKDPPNLPKSPRVVQLPQWLDDKIYGEMRASYSRSCCDMTVIDWNRTEIDKYLGTYFPRSYAESYCLFSDYLKVHAGEYVSRDSLSIFDFGCGTGGEILGFLDAVEKCLPSIKSVSVRALDGNQHALRALERVIRHRKIFGRVAVVLKTVPVIVDDVSDMNIIRSVVAETFDFFMTFKAVCEFVTKQQFEESNPYANVIRTFSDVLDPEGKMLIVDVSTKNGTSKEWLPKMLDAGINETGADVLARNDGFNETFVVKHTHAVADQSKIAWRFIQPHRGDTEV